MSGRGLGHTGGTIDKLESIKGFNTSISMENFIKQVNDIGIALVSQTGNLVPADKKIYALRDVSGTVESIPLIASSIMSKKIAFLFPGQGSQTVGMGKDLYESFESAKNVYDVADKVLGKSVSAFCFEGPEESLKQTINTQPCIVSTSIAALEALKSEMNITPDYVAGHSLGEYCAMYASGVMDLETTSKAIQKRADLMGATKGGAMAAILNAPEGSLEKALQEASSVGYVDVANYNSPAQVVITGDE